MRNQAPTFRLSTDFDAHCLAEKELHCIFNYFSAGLEGAAGRKATSKSMGGPTRFVASSYFLQPLKADANGSGKLGPPARHPTQRGLSLSAYQHDDRQDERHLDFGLAHAWSGGRQSCRSTASDGVN
ncbi:hypothetical protein EN780_26585 [Mesorhizobium sp. M4B.F.Ca.ET.089.01.1.1]|uniref:hypothetical protein n=1 Tax=Mesorhizobium sp. M4B.F.Ca.ET.089.01.1.1 TaxID=2496662 RepID=UPI000FE2A6F5|nr:hypothetical protein [Mesorhizobium sp. M4B.F.Ca.ET.089.01.1.1]RWX62449.1 hypothetical protein EN780_26585 [Mesorhizobium sp. M4B.F.Ca.ET.089.01.1.1]